MRDYTKFNVFAFLVSLTLSQTSLNAQVSKHLNGTEGNSNATAVHLAELASHAKDSLYKQMIIPKNGISNTANQKTTTINTHFPYPVIMVHGLAANSDTWLDLYNHVLTQGWSYGGRLDFCLNSDADNQVASLTTDIIDYTATSSLTDADFYLVNFDVNPNGTAFGNTVLSNQAAVYKQGIAMKKAINHVLTATGAEEVIVLVHSMGGLATRQYIQNPSLWQPDGKHHIAKLATLGTPHGGSNMSGTFALNWLFPPNVSSDAVRDLRRSYFYSGDPGVFLHGGLEDDGVMWDALFSDFYSTDVNCNGVSGDNIIGLNQKNIYTNIDYACLYGDYSLALTAGDAIVSVHDAQIKSFYPTLSAETFSCTANHVGLTQLINEDFLCIDEPDEFALGYYINKDTLYNGFITTQATDCPYITDYDQYHFNVQQTGLVDVTLGNWQIKPYRIKLLDAGFNTVLTQTFTTTSATTTAIPVTAGKYYLQLAALPNDTSWKYPYNYKINFTPAITTSMEQLAASQNISVFPNPVQSLLYINAENTNEEKSDITVTSVLGNIIYSTSTNSKLIKEQIDMAQQADGVYFITISNPTYKYTTKFLKLN